jgi:excinuclease UvrABC ATPase subunit
MSEKGTRFTRAHPFEGIIPNLERRYRETDSSAVREELAKYQNNLPALPGSVCGWKPATYSSAGVPCTN